MTPPTFPCRPINIGPLPHAPPLPGEWDFEPKGNGFRIMANTRHRLLWNRKNEPLSIAKEFTEALNRLAMLPFEWLDCEGLERRHGFGKGTLVVIDAPLLPGTYRDRRAILEKHIPLMICGAPELWAENDIRLFPSLGAEQALKAWATLQRINEQCGAQVWEGLVGKKADSLYPIQLRSPDEEFSGWCKARWRW